MDNIDMYISPSKMGLNLDIIEHDWSLGILMVHPAFLF